MSITYNNIYSHGEEFELLSEISKGANSICYKVRNLNSGKYYILKEYRPLSFQDILYRKDAFLVYTETATEEQKELFADYLERIMTKEHSIGRDLSAIHDNNNPYFFSPREFIPSEKTDTKLLLLETESGDTLKNIINKSDQIGIKEALEYLTQIITSIEYVHQRGYLHFDIKPENLYYSINGTIIIIDFGSAEKKDLSGVNIQELRRGPSYLGTEGYISPSLREVLRAKDNYFEYSDDDFFSCLNKLDVKCDLYSIVQCFLYMLTKHTMYQLRNDNGGISDDRTILLEALKRNKKIPTYLLDDVISIFIKAEREEYNSLDDDSPLIHDITELKNAFNNCGVHHSIILKSSLTTLKNRESSRQIKIYDNLLPNIGIKGVEKEIYPNLYEFVRQGLYGGSRKNYILTGNGGSGKSYSIYHLWEKLIGDEPSLKIIPLYIPMSELEVNINRPITTYVLQKYVGYTETNKTIEQMLLDFDKYLENDQYHYLLVLDGFNEITYSESVNIDIGYFEDMQNVNLLISSRNRPSSKTSFASYTEVTTMKLQDDIIRRVLSDKRLQIHEGALRRTLSNPMMLTIFSEAFSGNQEVKNLNTLDNATIISEYIKRQLHKQHILNDSETYFSVRLLWPLICARLDYDGCDGMKFEFSQLISVLEEIFSYSQSKVFLAEIFRLDLDRLMQYKPQQIVAKLIHVCLVDKMKLLVYDEENQSFQWAHEVFKDWFTAYGLWLMYKYDIKKSTRYLTRIVKEELATKNNLTGKKITSDIRLSNVTKAEYFCELLSCDEILDDTNDILTELIIRISYIYDDIKDGEKAYKYTMLAFDKLDQLPEDDRDTEFAEKINELSYSLCHLKDFGEAKLVEDALEYARVKLSLAKSTLERKKETCGTLTKEERINLAKVYGNLGAYWLEKRRHSPGGKRELCTRQSLEMHEEGFDIRKTLLDECDQTNEKDCIELENLIARGHTFLATDYFYLSEDVTNIEEKNYFIAESLKSHRKSLGISERLNNEKAIEESCIRIAGSLLQKSLINEQMDVDAFTEIVTMLEIATPIIKRNYYVGETMNLAETYKKILSFVADSSFDEKIEKRAVELAGSIDECYNSIMFSKRSALKEKADTIFRNNTGELK